MVENTHSINCKVNNPVSLGFRSGEDDLDRHSGRVCGTTCPPLEFVSLTGKLEVVFCVALRAQRTTCSRW